MSFMQLPNRWVQDPASRLWAYDEGSSAPWVPTDVAGIELWLRPDELPASGLVETWEDVSGKGRDVTQPVVASRGIVATHNGNKCVSYDGIDDYHYLDLGSSAFTGDTMSYYLAYAWIGSGEERFFGWGNASTHDEILMLSRQQPNVNGDYGFIGFDASSFTTYGYPVRSPNWNTSGGGVQGLRFTVGDRIATEQRDSVDVPKSQDTANSGTTGADRFQEIQVGRARTGEHGLMKVTSVLVYSTDLSDDDHALVMDHMSDLVGANKS